MKTVDELVASYMKAKPDVLSNRRSVDSLTPEEQAGNLLVVSGRDVYAALLKVNDIKALIGRKKFRACKRFVGAERLLRALVEQ